jgi:hypothetical protein
VAEEKKSERAAYVAGRRLADIDSHRARDRAYYHANKAKMAVSMRKSKLKRHYGITQDQFDAMLMAQGNACAICRSEEPSGAGSFHVDHCHTTQRVRGLLCHHCNLGLGNFKDNPESLTAALKYLAT